MKKDSLFFGFFKDLPSCFFQMIGRPESDAQRYALDSIEYKETAVRLDGVFRPLHPGRDPAYIWEAQNYASKNVYANLLSKIGRYLDHGDPEQDFVAVVIYPNRSLEQKNLHPYRFLLESRQLVRIYLDELPPAAPDQFGMGILELIAAKPEQALEKAQAMLPRVRTAKLAKQLQRKMLQFIETVILYQFPKWSREEVEKMLQVTDASQIRLFQEGREEGREEGKEEGREELRETMVRELLKIGRPVNEIAKVSGLTPAQIRKLVKKPLK